MDFFLLLGVFYNHYITLSFLLLKSTHYIVRLHPSNTSFYAFLVPWTLICSNLPLSLDIPHICMLALFHSSHVFSLNALVHQWTLIISHFHHLLSASAKQFQGVTDSGSDRNNAIEDNKRVKNRALVVTCTIVGYTRKN